MLRQVDRLVGIVVPRACLFCGLDAGQRACCEGCFADLPWIDRPCRRCGAPLPPGRPLPHCGDCRMPLGDCRRILSALDYVYPVDRIIGGAKFRQRLDFAATLGDLLGAFLGGPAGLRPTDLPDVIVPVPLHRRRLAARGFNQAAEIAGPVSQRLGLPLCIDACIRVRHTVEQMLLTGRDRRRNLNGAFVARRQLQGLRVAIVDDVLTTGTTVRAVAGAVHKAGAREVQVWTVARSG